MSLYPSNIPNPTSGTLFTSTATQTIAATVSETTIIGSGSGTLTIPASYFTVGKTVRFHVRGLYSTPALSVGNIGIKIKLGGTVLNTTATATALLVNTTNAGFEGTAIITCRATGASGSVALMAGVEYSLGANIAAAFLPINNGTSTTTIDTTVSQTFDCTVTWSNNTAGNSISSLNCLLEGLN